MAQRKKQQSMNRSRRWKLEDAKARFSELVREARERGPQRVTVYGKDAVVVVSADEFDRLQSKSQTPTPYELLARSPLKDLESGGEGVKISFFSGEGWWRLA